jgi:hypothetical protein
MIACAFCCGEDPNWVEIRDCTFLMCAPCLRNSRAATKIFFPKYSEEAHMAVYLKVRSQMMMLTSFEDFTEAQSALYEVIDQLTEIKLLMV